MGEVTIRAFNPYEAVFPDRKTISRPALDLAKKLRSEGHEVIIEPEDERKLEYLAQKGFLEDILSDPLILKVAGMSASVLAGFVANWLYGKFTSRSASTESESKTKVVIEVEEEGDKLRYSENGEPISDERFASLLQFMEDRQKAYLRARRQNPPTQDLKAPVFLEHSFQVVGWTRIRRTEKGLLGDPTHIFDEETLERIENGELGGFSVGGIVTESECTVCGAEYVECDHIAGEYYDGEECIVKVKSMDLCDVSVVK